MRRQIRLSAVVLALSLISVVGHTSQDQPTFRAEVRYIEVDVLVTDKDGNTVRGLTKEEFTLLEDGIPQEIASFSFIDLPVETAAERRATAAAVESDIVTNMDQGRMWVMLVNPGAPLWTRRLARQFIDEALGANDQMAIIHVQDTMNKAQALTQSRSRLLASIERITEAPALGDRDLMSFKVLEEISVSLGRMTGRRKAVLWFNPPEFFQPEFNPEDPGRLEGIKWFALRDALRAATRNNVAIYPIMPGLSTSLGSGALKEMAAARALAEDTGGDAIVNTNNFSAGFRRFVRDNSTYYLLGYVPAVDHRDGNFHPVTVRLNQPGLTVRARRGYYAPAPDTQSKPVPAVADGLSTDTAEALRMPVSLAGLGIDLFVTPFKGTGDKGSVLVSAQLRGADLALGAGERIEVAYQAMTNEGKITPGRFEGFRLDLTPESRALVERTGIRLIQRLELPRGYHQVRFVVHQPNGKTGSVVADVDIPDYGARLVMSGVAIGSQESASHWAPLTDPHLKELLTSDPTAVRRFSRSDVISAFAEVYWDPRNPPQDFRMTASLASARGAKVRTPTVTAVPAEAGRAGYVTRVPLADLAPGDYVLTLEARTKRDTAARRVPFAVIAAR